MSAKPLLVQEFLMHKTFGQLEKDHGVYASFSKSGRKFSLYYSQIEARDDDPLAQECRGLILACEDHKPMYCRLDAQGKRHYEDMSAGPTVVVAFPMRRFFNEGQGAAAKIDWSDPGLQIQEKMDGSLIIVYYDPIINQWCCATRAVSDADLLMDNQIFTFTTLFHKAVQETCGYSFDNLTSLLDANYTYCFELCTPLNRIVVDYTDYRITLLVVRSLIDHQEVPLDHPATKLLFDVPKVKTYSTRTLSELVDWVSTLSPLEHEGIVVCDSNFNRIKIKNAAYCAASRMRDSLGNSPRNCMELILLEQDDDALSFLPQEIAANLTKIKAGLHHAIQQHIGFYQEAVDAVPPGDKKAFALYIQQNKSIWTAPLFSIFGGKSKSIKDFIQQGRKKGTWPSSFLDRLLEISGCQ
jgi:hypothetical protein